MRGDPGPGPGDRAGRPADHRRPGRRAGAPPGAPAPRRGVGRARPLRARPPRDVHRPRGHGRRRHRWPRRRPVRAPAGSGRLGVVRGHPADAAGTTGRSGARGGGEQHRLRPPRARRRPRVRRPGRRVRPLVRDRPVQAGPGDLPEGVRGAAGRPGGDAGRRRHTGGRGRRGGRLLGADPPRELPRQGPRPGRPPPPPVSRRPLPPILPSRPVEHVRAVCAGPRERLAWEWTVDQGEVDLV